MSATLYLFVGYPGSGKTTAANIICKLTGAEHIWADRERQKMFGRPTHSPQESAALYHRLNERTRQLLLQDKSVVFDTNFNYRRDRDHLRGLARSAGADTVIIEMTTPEDTARRRALAGKHAEKNGMPNPMSASTFERIVEHRQTYTNDEAPVRLGGEDLTEASVKRALKL